MIPKGIITADPLVVVKAPLSFFYFVQQRTIFGQFYVLFFLLAFITTSLTKFVRAEVKAFIVWHQN